MRFKSLVFFCAISVFSNAQNVTEYRTWTKVSVGLKPAKTYKLNVSGRFRTNSGEGFDRFITIERRYKTAVGDFFMRYGVQHREVITGPGSRRTDFRARASYAYNIKNFKWDPQFNVEYIGVAGGNFDKSIRAGISTDHKLLSGKIKIGYFYEHNPQLLDSDCHTVSIGFKF